MDEDKTVRTVFVCVAVTHVVSHTVSTGALLLMACTTLYPLQHFSFCSSWKAGKLGAVKAACVWYSTQIAHQIIKRKKSALQTGLSWAYVCSGHIHRCRYIHILKLHFITEM